MVNFCVSRKQWKIIWIVIATELNCILSSNILKKVDGLLKHFSLPLTATWITLEAISYVSFLMWSFSFEH